MTPDDLEFGSLNKSYLKKYEKRAPDDSARFLRWCLENIFRLDQQDADDACVDGQQDKGIDGIISSNTEESIRIFQSKSDKMKKLP